MKQLIEMDECLIDSPKFRWVIEDVDIFLTLIVASKRRLCVYDNEENINQLEQKLDKVRKPLEGNDNNQCLLMTILTNINFFFP